MEPKKRQLRGSTSIFFCLTLLLVMSLLFTLLEGARVAGLKAEVRMNRDLAAQSVLAEYVTPLFEEYHIFAGSGTMQEVSAHALLIGEENLTWQGSGKRGLWMYPLHLNQATIEAHHLLTDDGGAAFYRQAAEYKRRSLAMDAAETIYSKVIKMQDASKEAGDLDEKVDNAKACVEQAAEDETEQAANSESGGEDTAAAPAGEDRADIENPLEYIGEWKSASVLTLLGADPKKLSDKKVKRKECLEKRNRPSGTWPKENVEEEWYDRILFQEYLLEQFESYSAGESGAGKERALEYEIEYLIAGKGADKKNLQSVLERMLLLREAANFVYLQTDAQKKAEALSLAAALAGATGNALLIKGVQQGILAVWAFAESIADVKSLLAGDKIPVLKTAQEWTTDVGGLKKEAKFESAKKCETGLSYEDYLRVLLFLTDTTELNYRAMDLIERNLQSQKGYGDLRMDALWDKCRIRYVYEAKPLFFPVVNTYHWECSHQAAYQTN